MNITLCTHHKGGVGKTELAIHLAATLEADGKRVLLVDCDSQASAWEFHAGSPPSREFDFRSVNERLDVLWNAGWDRLSRHTDEDAYDEIVLDIDSPLQNTVQTIVQNPVSKIYIPVNLQAGALSKLGDPLGVIEQLEGTIGRSLAVRIVPLGARLADIREELARLSSRILDLRICQRLRNLQRESDLQRRQRRYIWDHEGCSDVLDYYRQLLRT